MKERPIKFNAEMVRAILDGRKTQTRRIVKLPDTRLIFKGTEHGGFNFQFHDQNTGSFHHQKFYCPYGQPGDQIWVQEEFGNNGCEHCPTHYRSIEPDWLDESNNPSSRWYPLEKMSRKESHITLEITNIKVERLQDISEEDARAEGYVGDIVDGINYAVGSKNWFHSLWDSINDKREYAWDASPWVWVIEFKKIKNQQGEKYDNGNSKI